MVCGLFDQAHTEEPAHRGDAGDGNCSDGPEDEEICLRGTENACRGEGLKVCRFFGKDCVCLNAGDVDNDIGFPVVWKSAGVGGRLGGRNACFG